jgi:hypothetical protein
MDLGIVAAVVMLVVWAAGTFVMNDAPGWLHALLTAGVFLLIQRIVARGTPAPPASLPETRDGGDANRAAPGSRRAVDRS